MAELYGLLVEFRSAEALLSAARTVRDEGYGGLEAYTPYPVEGLGDILRVKDKRVPLCGLAGGLFGAALAFGMQVYFNLDYPLDVGGRDVISVPAFIVVTFELTILGTALFLIIGMLAMNRLPRLNHPLFAEPRFERVTRDRFFLCLRAHRGFDVRAARAAVEKFNPTAIREVPL